jgi:hypothetical protein
MQSNDRITRQAVKKWLRICWFAGKLPKRRRSDMNGQNGGIPGIERRQGARQPLCFLDMMVSNSVPAARARSGQFLVCMASVACLSV